MKKLLDFATISTCDSTCDAHTITISTCDSTCDAETMTISTCDSTCDGTQMIQAGVSAKYAKIVYNI